MNYLKAIGAAEGGRTIALEWEATLEEIAKMTNVHRASIGGTEVYSGSHPDHGDIHIVLPVFSGGMILLPFAIQSE